MKVIYDVHIPLRLVTYFNKQGVHAEHVNDLPDKYFTTDKVISEYADKYDLVIITKDVDFRNSYYIKNSPKRLIRICLGNLSTTEMITIMDTHIFF